MVPTHAKHEMECLDLLIGIGPPMDSNIGEYKTPHFLSNSVFYEALPSLSGRLSDTCQVQPDLVT